MEVSLDSKERLLAQWQHGFPICSQPFDELAAQTGLMPDEIQSEYRRALKDGRISRIGAVFRTGTGGAAILAAMSVPEADIEAVAALVSAHPGVNHNYLREHAFNLWFVMNATSKAAVESGIANLEAATGLRALRLPLVCAYHIDLGFDLDCARKLEQGFITGISDATGPKLQQAFCDEHAARSTSQATPSHGASKAIDKDLWPLAQLAEQGIEITSQPYQVWAAQLGSSESDVIQQLHTWLETRVLKRFGVVLRHHEFGFTANAMVVFDVPDDEAQFHGRLLALQPGVTLAYQRERDSCWPYNIYAMVHGTQRDAVEAMIENMTQKTQLGRFNRLVLFSTKRFKQTGARRFRGWNLEKSM
jgi:DNA-binding Lrp family transcriptional regulator